MAKTRTPAELKASKAEAKAARKAASKQRRAQLWQAFQMQRKEDKRLLPYMIGGFLAALLVSVASGLGRWTEGAGGGAPVYVKDEDCVGEWGWN